LSQCQWIIGYVIDTSRENPTFQYIWPDGYDKFYQYLLNYDGYIVWWNQIGFDNPVTVYNAGGTQEDIDSINAKSIDPFLFLWHLTGKRIWLNRASQALVWVKKTLESWAEAEVLYNKYLNEWDEKAMKELKKYCRNDVKMTLLTFLYLVEYLSIYWDGEQTEYTLEDMITKGQIPLWSRQTDDYSTEPEKWMFT
jgi:predicted PolB exonuclease-like 3'-5' exonuclease